MRRMPTWLGLPALLLRSTLDVRSPAAQFHPGGVRARAAVSAGWP